MGAVLIATLAAGLLVTLNLWLSGRPAMSVYDLIPYLSNQPLFQALLLLLLLLHGRTVLFRMDDREPEATR